MSRHVGDLYVHQKNLSSSSPQISFEKAIRTATRLFDTRNPYAEQELPRASFSQQNIVTELRPRCVTQANQGPRKGL